MLMNNTKENQCDQNMKITIVKMIKIDKKY